MSIFSSNKETNHTPAQNSNHSYTPPVTDTSNSQYSSNQYNTSNNNLTIIADGTSLDGQIKIEGDIRVDGAIKGTLTSKSKVIIGNNGKVDGDIICQNADISGTVIGKVKVADILFLKGTANIDGDINTGKLVIESGVKFNGNCIMGGLKQTEKQTITPSSVTTPV